MGGTTLTNNVAHTIAIENVIQLKMRGRVLYQGHMLAADLVNMTYLKMWDDPSGEGYQRDLKRSQVSSFVNYLTSDPCAVVTPLFMNGQGNWEFTPYNKQYPQVGRLICRRKASVIDGQHRRAGIIDYIEKTSYSFNVPFMVFHNLDPEEEINMFNVINKNSSRVSKSLSYFLERTKNDNSWVATKLVQDERSPFHNIASITGSRSNGRHITLQNLFQMMQLITRSRVFQLPRDEVYSVTLEYFRTIRDMFSEEWKDYRGQRVTHIVGLNALSMLGRDIMEKHFNPDDSSINTYEVITEIKRLRGFDWSFEGEMKLLSGRDGAQILAEKLKEHIKKNAPVHA